jgi:uroporphyrinogen-III decarboxylase
MCLEEPALAHAMLDKYADSLCVYASHQIESGAQIMQIFESWSHHMSEEQFCLFAKPYVSKVASYLKEKHPEVPVVYFANGGSAYLHAQTDLPVDGLSVDWKISMAHARKVAPNTVLAGNTDPITLYGKEEDIRAAARLCISQGCDVLNLGHGVEKDTKEESVAAFVDEAKNSFK